MGVLCLYVCLQNMYYFLGEIFHHVALVVASQGPSLRDLLPVAFSSLPHSKVFAAYLPFPAPWVILSCQGLTSTPHPGFALSLDRGVSLERAPPPTVCL